MVDAVFPQSPNWYSSKVLSTREDGLLAYGSQNCIVILKYDRNKIYPHLIKCAHNDKITSVILAPINCSEKHEKLVLSSSEDGFVKLWNIDTLKPVIGHNSHWDQKDPVKILCSCWSYYNPQYIVSAAENDTVILWDIIDNITVRFSFPRLKPSVIECSYHSEKIVAVGSKSGLIYILNLLRKGEILHKFRGHDKEIQALSWCPVADTSGEYSDVFKQHLLASTCQEKEIIIWQTLNGQCLDKIQLPKNALSKGENHCYGRSMNTVNFVPLFWAEPHVLYSGTKFGELISYDVKSLFNQKNKEDISEKQLNKKILNFWSLVHSHHTNAVLVVFGQPHNQGNFNIVRDRTDSSVEESGNCNGLDKQDDVTDDVDGMSFKRGRQLELNKPRGLQNLIWTLGKDQKLIAVHKNSGSYDVVFCFDTINGHAFEAAVSVHDPNKIAIAAGDGKVRLWNVSKPSGQVRVFWQKIKDRVYSLAWHPSKEGVLAFGTSEGRVGIIEIYSQKQPHSFRTQHSDKVYRLSWGPAFLENEDISSWNRNEFCLYSVGGNNLLQHNHTKPGSDTLNLTKIVNIPCKKFSDLCWKPDYSVLVVGCSNGNVYLLKPPRLEIIYVLTACKKNIQSFAWHPTTTTLDSDCSEFQGYFTLGSTDKESLVKVYNYSLTHCEHKVEQIAAFKGHTGYVQFVSWSPHVGGRIVSTGSDFSVRIWDVGTHSQLAVFICSQTILPLFCIWSPINPDVLIAGLAERMVISWNTSAMCGGDVIIKENDIKKCKTLERSAFQNPSESGKELEKKSKSDSQATKKEIIGLALAKAASQKNSDGNKMFTKAWTSSRDAFQNCYELLKENDSENKTEFIFPFLSSESKFLDFLNMEAQSYERSNNWRKFYQLALWRGDLRTVLEEKIQTGHLDEFLVSLAPFVSPRLWHDACISYAKSLAESQCYRMAACYLIAVHKIYDAIEMLLNADLYLEAICIARCRLPLSDPIHDSIIQKYADWLVYTGSFVNACECYIYLKDYIKAATILAKKNKPEYLSLAALAARKASSQGCEKDYAYSALLLSLETLNFELASRICTDHHDLKELSVLNSVHRIIYQLDVEEIVLETDLITYLYERIGADLKPSLYDNLHYIYDKNSLYTEKEKLYLAVAQELSLACCAEDKQLSLTHIIRSMYAASRFTNKNDDEIHPLFKLCLWLSPKGNLMKDSIFSTYDSYTKPKVTSLRAFLCQGIAEHIDKIKCYEVMANNDLEDILLQVIDDALDKDSFAYFKNEIVIKASEKKISEAYQRLNQEISKVTDNEETDESTILVKDSTSNEGKGEIILDISISEEKENMVRLKNEIKNFERTRIIAPNPAYIHCVLRRVCHILPKGSELSNVIEDKWKVFEMI